jgi:hypothetical protein
MHAPTAVSDAYNAFVAAAQREAGAQMTAAWKAHPTTADEQVPLGEAYDRSISDAARDTLISAMKADLGSLD